MSLQALLPWQDWLASVAQQRWLPVALVVSLQVLFIATIASFLSAWCRQNPWRQHLVWLVSTLIVLAILPFHAMSVGFPFSVVAAAAKGPFVANDSTPARGIVPKNGVEVAKRLAGSPKDGLGSAPIALIPSEALVASEEWNSIENRPPGTLVAAEPVDENAVRRAADSDDRWQFPPVADSLIKDAAWFGGIHWSSWLLVVYLLGLIWTLGRLVRGAFTLRWLVAEGRPLDASSAEIFADVMQSIGLKSNPVVAVVERVVMPLSFGIGRRGILLPKGFDEWPASERRAVLLHELMHLRRGDVYTELIARLMRAVYWFHPATAMLHRRLCQSRELVTDRCVIDVGEDPQVYARSLVDVVSKLRIAARDACDLQPVVSMAASSDLEARVKQLLRADSGRSLLPSPVLVAVLVGSALLTTIRLEVVYGQGRPGNDGSTLSAATQGDGDGSASSKSAGDHSKPDDGQVVDQETSRLETVDEEAADDGQTDARNDAQRAAGAGPNTDAPADAGTDADAMKESLVERVKECDVLEVTGDDYFAIFTVSGRVVSPDGEPVAGAVVVLRESSTARISAEYRKYGDRTVRHTIRVADVFARTTTDEEGRFAFNEAKAPSYPRTWTSNWRGDVIAAHESFGIGWLPLGDSKERVRVENGLLVPLQPTGSIHGTFVTPDGNPIRGEPLRLNRFDSLATSDAPLNRARSLDLQSSQLMPTAVSGSDGQLEFRDVPLETVAILISRTTDDWTISTAAVATSQMPAGSWRDHYGTERSVSASPFRFVADPGVKILGKVVDTMGMGVGGAEVKFASYSTGFKTDADGSFLMRMPSSSLSQRFFDRSEPAVKFSVTGATDSDLLPAYIDVPLADIQSGRPVSLTMQHGVRVTGKVLLDDGRPQKDVLVRPLSGEEISPYGGATDEDGVYSFLVPAEEITLAFGTDEPGLALPDRRSLYRMSRDSKPATDGPTITVDLRDGQPKELEPLVVKRIESIAIRVLGPDGKPAAGATAVLQDVEPERSVNPRFSLPPRYRDRSDTVVTDSQGLALLRPLGALSPDAHVECKLTTGERSYFGQRKISESVDGVLTIPLKAGWMVMGRVTMDGEPLSGVQVSIGQATRYNRGGPGGAPVGATAVSVSNFVQAITGADGVYRAAVEPDHQYSISIMSMPDGSRGPGMGLSATMETDGLLKVRDFEFSSQSGEVAGRVVDGSGKPLPGARVYVARVAGSSPDFWIGHQSESQMETDASGKFHLKKMPEGRHRLHVSGPRVEGQRSTSTFVEASTGEMDRVIVIDARPIPELPRLQPQRVIDVQSPFE